MIGPGDGSDRGLQIEDDLEFHERIWSLQRAGWIAISALLLAALIGLFGGGPVSSSSAGGSGLTVEYERFGRSQQPMNVRFRLDSRGGTTAKIYINREYLESVHVENVTPEPDAVEAGTQWLVYSFSRRGPTAVTFHLKPLRFGSLPGEARLAEGERVAFKQLIYP